MRNTATKTVSYPIQYYAISYAISNGSMATLLKLNAIPSECSGAEVCVCAFHVLRVVRDMYLVEHYAMATLQKNQAIEMTRNHGKC